MTPLFKRNQNLKRESKTAVKIKPPVKNIKPVISSTSKSKTGSSQLKNLQAKAREIILEARDEAIQIKDEAVKTAQQKLKEIDSQSQQIQKTQRDLISQESSLEKEKKQLENLKAELKTTQQNLLLKHKKLIKELEKVSSLTESEAKKKLLEQVKKQSRSDTAKTIREIEEKAKVEADDIAREIIAEAMRDGATDYVAEYTISTIKITDEETKSRIIGKEGRNIRAFEKVSGVDLVMDETPGEVKLSSFDSVRREIAKVALVRLVKDGRIQPSRIEEYLFKAKKDIQKVIFQEGKNLCQSVNVFSLPQELIATLGRFKFRTSYGQNMISHTLEVVRIGTKLAQELGANMETVKLGCLLHDVGKVLKGDGNHVELGNKYLKKFNLPQPVLDAVAQHHEDEAFTSTESVLVYIADAISGARSGARRENVEEYINRIKQLEKIATEHPEVKDAFAIQAGREVRVIVHPDKIDDDQLTILAANIRDEVRDNLTFPGTVKINVIREVRVSEIAK